MCFALKSIHVCNVWCYVLSNRRNRSIDNVDAVLCYATRVHFSRYDVTPLSLASLPGVTAVVCDALDLKGVEGVLDGCDAAITTLGGAPGDEEKRVDYVGNRNVIESAGILGITRLVLVTSVGCGSSREAISEQDFQVTSSAAERNKLCSSTSCFSVNVAILAVPQHAKL